MNDKIRPMVERIARLEGTTIFRDLREGFGGRANITDHDIAAALAMVIKRAENGHRASDDIGAELLETYYGSTQTYRRKLVQAFLFANPPRSGASPCPRRMGATLAAQELAGVRLAKSQEVEYAYIAYCKVESLRDEMRIAGGWFDSKLMEAKPEFMEVLKNVIEERLDPVSC